MDRKFNAMKHGAFARTLILPGESADEYRALVHELALEWMPGGISEMEDVRNLAILIFKLMRCERYYVNNMRNELLATSFRVGDDATYFFEDCV